ncbi:unnamed protein product, partial [Aureobasidium uvarum]
MDMRVEHPEIIVLKTGHFYRAVIAARGCANHIVSIQEPSPTVTAALEHLLDVTAEVLSNIQDSSYANNEMPPDEVGEVDESSSYIDDERLPEQAPSPSVSRSPSPSEPVCQGCLESALNIKHESSEMLYSEESEQIASDFSESICPDSPEPAPSFKRENTELVCPDSSESMEREISEPTSVEPETPETVQPQERIASSSLTPIVSSPLVSASRAQKRPNYNFMGFDQPTSEVDVVVRYLEQKYYQATIADKSSGEDVVGEPHEARTVERALTALLAHTCAHLGNPPNLIGAGATQTLGSPVAKRGRGRPKSILPSATSSVVKPKATKTAPATKAKVSATVTPKATRGRGRPRKSDVVALTSTGRPRGRPRKNTVTTAPAVEATTDGAIAPAKRGRGRPRKSDSTPAAATTGSKRDASALEDDEPASKKSRKAISDEEMQDRISADELGEVEEAGQTAPFTPQVWFPTYVSRIARVVYHCIADGSAGGLTEDELMSRTGLPYTDINAGIMQLSEKGGIIPAIGDDSKWTVLDEWEDEEE